MTALEYAPVIPFLIACLEDDVARADAMAVLVRFDMTALSAATDDSDGRRLARTLRKLLIN